MQKPHHYPYHPTSITNHSTMSVPTCKSVVEMKAEMAAMQREIQRAEEQAEREAEEERRRKEQEEVRRAQAEIAEQERKLAAMRSKVASRNVTLGAGPSRNSAGMQVSTELVPRSSVLICARWRRLGLGHRRTPEQAPQKEKA